MIQVERIMPNRQPCKRLTPNQKLLYRFLQLPGKSESLKYLGKGGSELEGAEGEP